MLAASNLETIIDDSFVDNSYTNQFGEVTDSFNFQKLNSKIET